MNILDTIIAKKKEEVEERKAAITLQQLEQQPLFKRTTVSLKERLNAPGATGIIAEFKRKSPSKGWINEQADVMSVVQAYEQYGASGISVLTDTSFFGGGAADFATARATVQIPLLRKDFMIDAYQLHEAKAMGADVVLLIAACLSVEQAKSLAAIAKQLSLEVLLEIHDATELDHINEHIDMVGVNNRNLKTFDVDINTSLDLINKMPTEITPVTESGIGDMETMVILRHAGFKGFLIGEQFMKQPAPTIAFAAFTQQIKAPPL